MTVSAQTPINRSTGNGVTTVFPYTFKIISDADIEVTVDDVVKTLNVDYTVSGAGVDAGGNVTMTGAPANATSVVRRRNMALVRSTDYQDQGELPATTLDNDIDATVLMVQQLDERLDRTFSLPASFSGDSTLPAPEPGYLIGWDATGENLTNIPASVGSSLVDIAAPSGSSLVGYLPAGTGAVSTTVQAKLRESVSILDFGGVSGADCTAAFTAAFAALASGGKLYLPPGTWQTTGGHTVPQRVSIVGAGMGVSIIQHTSANNVLFNQPLVGGNETTVEYGGNVYQGFTAYGTSAANTATAIKIKNKVNIKFDHVELYDFGTLVAGVRDNVANSVNSVLFNGIRFGACVTAINAPLAWNGVTIQGASQFFSSTGWTIINYDSANWNIDASTTFTANQTGTGHIYFGGCTGWVVNAYFEGNPTIGYYFSARSQKDKDGNATNGGIAIGYVRSGTMQGMTARSAGGTSYVVHLDATSCVVATGCHAGSGINVSFAYVTTGTRSNSFIGCYSNPGTVATFQTAADADYNIVQNYLTGSLSASKAFPTAPVVVGGTSAGASTGGTQTGYYCRVGDVCHFTVSVNWTSHTGTGQLRINNLPFTSNANTVQTFSARVATTSAGDTTQITGFIPAGSTQLRLEKYAAGGVTDLAIPGAGNFVISGSYLL